MALGYNNITMDNITSLVNNTNPAEFTININWIIFDGWFVFVMLLLSWFVLFSIAQFRDSQPLPNLVLTGGVITIVSLLLRFVYVVTNGVFRGLLTDSQMWLFPILTIIFAIIAIMMKE